MGGVVDREAPFYFTKAAIHYAPSGTTIGYPAGTTNYHYEMEFVVAIGKAGLLPPILSAWTPNIIVSAAAIYLLLTTKT